MTSKVDTSSTDRDDATPSGDAGGDPSVPRLVDVSIVVHTTPGSTTSDDAVVALLDAIRSTGRSAEAVLVRKPFHAGPTAEPDPSIRVLRRDSQQHAQPTTQLRTGLAAARGRVVGVVHPDSGIDPDALGTLVDLCEQGWDIALGVRTLGRRTDPTGRGAGRRAELLRRAVHMGVDPAFDGTRPSAMMMTRDAAEAVLPHLRADDDTFDLEVLALARRLKWRRHAYQPVPHHGTRRGIATDHVTAWTMTSVLQLAVRLRRTADLDKVGTLKDLRPRAARIEERRVNHIVGMALRLTAAGVDPEEAADELIAAADRRRVLLEIACDMCSHDDRRSAGIRWSEAEPLLRRASMTLRTAEIRRL